MDNSQRWHGPFIFSSIFSLFLWDIPPFSLLICILISVFVVFNKNKPSLSVFLFAFSWFFIHAHWATHWHLPKTLIKKPVMVIGIVWHIPRVNHQDVKFSLKLESLDGVAISPLFRPLIKLSWQDSNQLLKMGDRVSLIVKLKPPHGFANQGGFSYQKWLLLKGFRATGYVVNKTPMKVIKKGSSLRQTIFDQLEQKTSLSPYQGLLLALSIGEKHHISDKQWQLIKGAGISHLLAISGLHIGIVFLFATLITKFVTKSVCLIFDKHCNAPLLGLIGGMLAAISYAWLAGFSLPTVRALIMLSVVVMAIGLKRNTSSRSILTTALVAILMVSPLSLLEPGLWLSFMAVIIIVTTFWWLPNGKNGWRLFSLIKMQLALFVFMLPLSVIIFNGYSLFSSLVNLLAVPWVSFVTVPITLIATVFILVDLPADWLMWIASQSLRLLFVALELPWLKNSWQSVGHLPWYCWLCLALFCVGWLMPMSRKIRLVSLILILPASLSLISSNDHWKINVLDVGQGLSVAIEKNNQLLIYDLGPIYKSGFNTVEHVVLPFMVYNGYDSVDQLFISHSDSDHAGAFNQFVSATNPNIIYAPHKVNPTANRCFVDQYQWQGLQIDILWPIDQHSQPSNSNDSSCVVRISSATQSVLLTGDISKRVEQMLVDIYGAQLHSTILLAPHHGSNSSSSQGFIDAVNPQYVIYSSGFLNRYNFPRQAVQARYQSHSVIQLNTAQTGQITFKINQANLELSQARTDVIAQWFYNQ
jgi:competence protein ComEC